MNTCNFPKSCLQLERVLINNPKSICNRSSSLFNPFTVLSPPSCPFTHRPRHSPPPSSSSCDPAAQGAICWCFSSKRRLAFTASEHVGLVGHSVFVGRAGCLVYRSSRCAHCKPPTTRCTKAGDIYATLLQRRGGTPNRGLRMAEHPGFHRTNFSACNKFRTCNEHPLNKLQTPVTKLFNMPNPSPILRPLTISIHIDLN